MDSKRANTATERHFGPTVFRALVTRIRLRLAWIQYFFSLARKAPTFSLVEHCKSIVSLTEEAYGESSRKTIDALWILGQMYREVGNPEAEIYLRRCLTLARTNLDPQDSKIPVILNGLGGICRILGRFEEAESLYREAWALDE